MIKLNKGGLMPSHMLGTNPGGNTINNEKSAN